MAKQLVLIEATDVDWRLDERTRELGRAGIAEARRALHAAVGRTVPDEAAAAHRHAA